MKVATKLAVGSSLLLGLLAGLLVYHVSTVQDNAEAGRELSELTSRLLLSATDQRYWLSQMEESITKFRISRDSGYLRQFREYADRFDGALAGLDSLSLSEEEGRALSRLTTTWRGFRLQAAELATAGLEAAPPPAAAPGEIGAVSGLTVPGASLEGRVGEGRDLPPERRLDRWFLALQGRTEDLVRASRRAMAGRVEAATRRAERARVVAWAGASAALLLIGAVWFYIVRSIGSGLRSLTEGTRQVANGDFGHRLDADGEDEFAELARDFNAMTERLGELDELKRNFVSRVSHDLKSPLASIREANALLLDGLVGELSEDQRWILERNRENGERLASMISKLLDVTRLEAGAEQPELREHDLSERARTVAERLSTSFRKREVELDLRLPDGPVRAVFDVERVEQVLENLLENARRFAPEGSTVRIVVEELAERPDDVAADRWCQVADGAGRAVRVAVADSGPGVTPGEEEKIFSRFVQGDGAGRKDGDKGGVGLGLALCREVADAHGGSIWASEAPGGGALFTVLLPADPRETAEAGAA